MHNSYIHVFVPQASKKVGVDFSLMHGGRSAEPNHAVGATCLTCLRSQLGDRLALSFFIFHSMLNASG